MNVFNQSRRNGRRNRRNKFQTYFNRLASKTRYTDAYVDNCVFCLNRGNGVNIKPKSAATPRGWYAKIKHNKAIGINKRKLQNFSNETARMSRVHFAKVPNKFWIGRWPRFIADRTTVENNKTTAINRAYRSFPVKLAAAVAVSPGRSSAPYRRKSPTKKWRRWWGGGGPTSRNHFLGSSTPDPPSVYSTRTIIARVLNLRVSPVAGEIRSRWFIANPRVGVTGAKQYGRVTVVAHDYDASTPVRAPSISFSFRPGHFTARKRDGQPKRAKTAAVCKSHGARSRKR